MHHGLLAAVCLSTLAHLSAQTMLKDINATTTNPGSGIGTGLTLAGITYFAANDGLTGAELWRTDGTAGGTALVKDINPGSASSSPSNLRVLGGRLLFTATTAANGTELWRSDGTAVGTQLVKDIGPGTGSSSPGPGVVLGGALHFAANDSVNGTELWRSDGTAAGTFLVKDINTTTATASSSPSALFAWNGRIYMQASVDAIGTELWASDGTTAGTVLVKDIAQTPATTSSSSPTLFTDLGSKLLFAANDGLYGTELWSTDGTAAYTVLVKDINTVAATAPALTAAASPSGLTVWNGKCYFSANDGLNGAEPWQSDGTAAGTVLLKDLNLVAATPPVLTAGSAPSAFTPLASVLLFLANDGVRGTELWSTDGTGANTALVKDINGTSAASGLSAPIVLGGKAWFQANDAVNGAELWQSDGTAAGTVMFKNINTTSATASSSPTAFALAGARFFFAANDGVVGAELWVCDGTAAGTKLVADLALPVSGSANPASAVLLGSAIVFAATDGVTGTELWKSDGTAAGTVQVKDINTAAAGASSLPSNLVVLGTKALFAANDGVNGTELWSSDGTTAGTQLVLDINPGAPSSSPSVLTVSGSKVFFTATQAASGTELWVSDGTAAGTKLVTDLNPGAANGAAGFVKSIAPIGAGVLFNGITAATGQELYFSDGSAAGTVLVKDLTPGAADGPVFELTRIGSKVFFSAGDPTSGYEAWTSDGTAAGTALLKDIEPGAVGSFPSGFYELTGRCLFAATTSAAGTELWSSDGTTANTKLLVDIYPGTSGSAPFGFVRANDRVFFIAVDGTPVTGTGRELWMTDGTAAGTAIVADIGAGLASGCAAAPFAVGSGRRVVLAADDGLGSGIELWTSDGTAAGTRRMGDLAPRNLNATPGNFVELGTNLLFAANDFVHGTELFSMRLASLGATLATTFGTGCPGVAGVPTIGNDGLPFAGNSAFAVTLTKAAPLAPCAIFLSATRGDLAVGNGCTLYPSINPVVSITTTTDQAGATAFRAAVPNLPVLVGRSIYFQWVVIDAAGTFGPGLCSASVGLQAVIG